MRDYTIDKDKHFEDFHASRRADPCHLCLVAYCSSCFDEPPCGCIITTKDAVAEAARMEWALYICYDRIKEYPDTQNLLGTEVLETCQRAYDKVRKQALDDLEEKAHGN